MQECDHCSSTRVAVECLVLGSFISALMYCSLVTRDNRVVKEHLFNRMDSLLAIGQAVPEMAKLLFEVQ